MQEKSRSLAEELREFELQDREQVHDLKDPERIYDEKYHEPPRLSAHSGMPERKPFPKDTPQEKEG